MRIRHDHVLLRVLGVAMGLGFLGLAVLGNHAWGLGLVLFVGGAAAIIGSLTVVDPTRIW